MSERPEGPPALQPPSPIRIGRAPGDADLPNEVEMPLVDHLEELRQRVLRSLLAVVFAALTCLLGVKPLVRLLERQPAEFISFNWHRA